MTVNYNQKFIETFAKYKDKFVIIGGTATAIQLEQRGIKSRTTKDYDMVLINDEKDLGFYDVFVNFLKEGEYNGGTIDQTGRLYRFRTRNKEYPAEIELFTKRQDFNLKADNFRTPVRFAENASLSALLLDDDYYHLLEANVEYIDEYPVLSRKALIIFKAKAWMDLSERKVVNHQVDSKDIKKHLNDIVRLVGSLEDLEKLVNVPENIAEDMEQFLQLISQTTFAYHKEIGLKDDEIKGFLKELLVEK